MRVAEALRRAGADGIDYHEEFRLVHPDGTIVWVVDRGRASLGPTGKPCMSGVILDVTKRRQAEQALRTSEERFHVFMANSPAAAWILDVQGHFVFVSPPFLRTIFAGGGSPVGKSIFEVFPEPIARSTTATTTSRSPRTGRSRPSSAECAPDGSEGYFSNT